MNRKIDEVIRYISADGYICGGHLGGNEPVGYKYLHKKQIPLKKTKKGVRKGK